MTREEATAIVPLIEEQTNTVALIKSHLIPDPIFAKRELLGSLFTANPPRATLIGARETHLPVQSTVVQVDGLDTPADLEASWGIRIAVKQMKGP